MIENVDHLIYATPELERGRDEIESVLGVRPVVGGRHPDFGTHNALLSLGEATYLEIIAPDPAATRPERGFLFGLDLLEESRLATWVLRTRAIEELASTAAAARDVGLGAIRSGGREKPDGTRLEWRLTDPHAMPHGGAVPFLIDWGSTPHPAATAPRGGTLVDLAIRHPEAERVARTLALLGAPIDVAPAAAFRLVARIETPNGVVHL